MKRSHIAERMEMPPESIERLPDDPDLVRKPTKRKRPKAG